VRLQTVSGEPVATLHYAWRADRGPASLGRALQWWLAQLQSPTTRRALVERHSADGLDLAEPQGPSTSPAPAKAKTPKSKR
jgi:hypothetical protein